MIKSIFIYISKHHSHSKSENTGKTQGMHMHRPWHYYQLLWKPNINQQVSWCSCTWPSTMLPWRIK